MDFPALLAALRSCPATLEAVAEAFSSDDAGWKPAPDKWCLAEIIGHMLDEEVDDFRARIASTLTDPLAPWPTIEPEEAVRARGHASADHRDLLGRWREERQQSLTWLADLQAPDWTKTYDHSSFGPLSAGELLAAWVAHDSLHMRQIAHLIFLKTKRDAEPFSTRYAG